MAQKTKALSTRARMLARRYGLVGKTGVAIACVLLVVAVTATGLFSLNSSGIVVSRVEERMEEPSALGESPSTGDSSETTGGDEVTLSSPSPQGEDATEAAPAYVVVHIDGAVTAPGVYEIHSNTPRMNDAVMLAGGLTPDADTTAINLAATVTDGQKLHVPAVGEQPQASQALEQQAQAPNQTSAANEYGADAAPMAYSTDGTTNNGQALVNINTASDQELQTLTGIGEATASAIIEERERNGAFAAPEDLMRVSGIGEKKFAKIRDFICV